MRAILTSLLALSFAAPARAEDLKPVRTLVETSVNQVLAILKDKALERDAKKKKVMAVGEELFDMALMSKLVLGRDNWPKFDAKQQKEFSDLFVKQLQDSYFEKVDLLTDETVEFVEPALQKDGKVLMLTHTHRDDRLAITGLFVQQRDRMLLQDSRKLVVVLEWER
ncbi:MAG: ABC transporter substrate-binding protein, partial [Elusimicrobia bacterium]|nr:ABC transporter substrate-binding protein [Elusimicrobiota bacterium]